MLRLIYGILVLLVLILGCSDIPSGSSISRPIVLAYGESAEIADGQLRIKFADVVTDLRCPMDLFCNWEGIAEIELLIFGPDSDSISAIIAISHKGDSDINSEPPICVDGNMVTLIGLDPYPVFNGPAQDENYSATLDINYHSLNCVEPPYDPVHFSSDPPTEIMLDPFELNEVEIDGDILMLSVSYSGGCESHDFWLFMSPPVFLESYPVQANLYLRHDGHNDACEAYITEEISFDVNRIRDLYYEFYGGYDDIILNVFHYYEDLPGEKISVTYSTE